MRRQRIECDGLSVTAFRSRLDSQLVVSVETHDLDIADTHDGEIPKIIVAINDAEYAIDEAGEFFELGD
jgi:hypothetical protein